MKGSILDYQFKSISIKVVKWDILAMNRQLKAYWKVSLICLCSLWVSIDIPCHAQQQETGGESASESASDITLPPDNQVLDQANVFLEHPDVLAEMVGRLSRMKDDYEYPVYLAVYYNVLDASLRERADQLYESWIGESGRGMVIVYQLDPVVYGNNPAMAYHKGDGLDPKFGDGSSPIPERDMIAMLTKISPQVDSDAHGHHASISALVLALEAEITRYHDTPAASWKDSDSLIMIAVFSAFVIAIPLIGMLIRRLLLNSSNQSRKTYYFPDVQVAYRLGAAYGGGWVSEKSFAPPSPQQSNVSPG